MLKLGELINDKYKVISKIGEGGMGVTFLAEQTWNGGKVVLKSLHMERLSEWKSMDLFRREASVLRNMAHPNIPEYIDYFEYGEGSAKAFVLVQEFMPGENLLKKTKAGWHADDETVVRIAIRLFSIIAYIHGLRPPIIHRDINPKNIIMDDNGEVYLVDFGSVQDIMKSEIERHSTFVGTPGYTPIEQFQGKATPKSDLYAAAATIVYLLTHREVTDLITEGNIPDVRSFTQSEKLRVILGNYLQPDQRSRTITVSDAIGILEGKIAPPHGDPGTTVQTESGKPGFLKGFAQDFIEEIKKASGRSAMMIDPSTRIDPGPPPAGSSIEYERNDDSIRITVPAGRGSGSGGIGVFAIIWNAFVLFFTLMIFGIGFAAEEVIFPFFFMLFLLPFWGVGIGFGYSALFNRFGRTTVSLLWNSDSSIDKKMFRNTTRTFATESLLSCDYAIAYTSNNVPVYHCKLVTSKKGYGFGQKLSNTEKKWVCDAVNSWLNNKRGR